MTRRRFRALPGLVVLCVTATVITAPPAQSESGDTYYMTKVVFKDGSSVTARSDSGIQHPAPALDGSAGEARAALEAGAVDTAFTDSSPEEDVSSEMKIVDSEALPTGDSGDETVRARARVVERPSRDLTTQAETPDGFRLFGTNTTAYGYIYTSDYVGAELYHCSNGMCDRIGRVDVRIKEYLYGGDSINWRITPSSVYRFGPPYSVDFEYWCGVNLKWQSDITCRTDDDTASPSGEDFYGLASHSVGNNSWPFVRSFGRRHADNAKYPLIEMRTTWPGHPTATVTVRFRGWDIRRYDGVWKMAPVSGTGT